MGMMDKTTGNKVYLDTNIFIYALEGFSQYLDILTGLFNALDEGVIIGVTSELTLAEVLIKPMRDNNEQLQKFIQIFYAHLTL